MKAKQTSESVEVYFYRRILQFCLAISVINIISNNIVGLDFEVNIKWIILLPISIYGLRNLENEKLRNGFLAILFGFIIFLFIPSGWKTTGGYNYLTLGYTLLVAMAIGFLMRGKTRVLFATLELVMFLYLMYMQYSSPDFVDVVPSHMFTMDLYIQTPIVFLSAVYMASVFADAWRNERKRLQIYSDLLHERNTELDRITKTDELTGLYNRRYLFGKLEEIVKLNQSVTIVMIDIDDFKKVNDKYGHIVGDEVIVEVGTCIADTVKGNGFVGRYGGDEFVIVIEKGNDEDILRITDEIQNKISHLSLKNEINITISGGITKLQPDAMLDDVLSCADEIMYWAKQNGKAQIVFSNSEIAMSARLKKDQIG